MRQASLFGLSDHLERLGKDGDPLEVLEATVDLEHFHSWLVEGLGYGDGSKGGRPGLPTRLMAGLHILKHVKGLSNEAVCAAWVENPYFQTFCSSGLFSTSCRSTAAR